MTREELAAKIAEIETWTRAFDAEDNDDSDSIDDFAFAVAEKLAALPPGILAAMCEAALAASEHTRLAHEAEKVFASQRTEEDADADEHAEHLAWEALEAEIEAIARFDALLAKEKS